MRVFVAFDIDDVIRERLSRFVDRVRELAPEAHWMRPESWHVTLKFLGEQSDRQVDRIRQALVRISAGAVSADLRGYGFFPDERIRRVFWIGLVAGPHLACLAGSVDASMSPWNIPKEEHPYTPHLTLARASGSSGSPRKQKIDRPNLSFLNLQEYLRTIPPLEFGSMTVKEFFLYQSEVSSRGAHYTKLAAFALS